MRVIRANGQNVSPSDDGKLFNMIFSDGLFNGITINSLGAALVHIPAMYGIMMGREFVTEEQDITVKLPSSETTNGYIVVKYDLATENVISIVSYLGSYTPTKEDINTNGSVYEMIIATYTATNLAVEKITMAFSIAIPSSTNTAKFNVAASSWSSSTKTIDGRDYYYQDLTVNKIIDSYPIIEIGATGTLPTEEEEQAYATLKYAYLYEQTKTLTLYCLDKPTSNFVILVKGVK
jgi:hypothetical protein